MRSRRMHRPALLLAGLLAVAACGDESDESVLSTIPDEPPEPDREFACDQAATFITTVQELPDEIGADPTSEDIIRSRNAVIDAWRQLDNAVDAVPGVSNEDMQGEDQAGVVGDGGDDLSAGEYIASWNQLDEALQQLDVDDQYPAALAAVEGEAEAVVADTEDLVDELGCV